jgi:hypothetical protein
MRNSLLHYWELALKFTRFTKFTRIHMAVKLPHPYNGKLYERALHRASARTWRMVLECFEAGAHPRAQRNIKRIIRSRRNPPLIHNGRKAR